jgi:hypothetical protein
VEVAQTDLFCFHDVKVTNVKGQNSAQRPTQDFDETWCPRRKRNFLQNHFNAARSGKSIFFGRSAPIMHRLGADL